MQPATASRKKNERGAHVEKSYVNYLLNAATQLIIYGNQIKRGE